MSKEAKTEAVEEVEQKFTMKAKETSKEERAQALREKVERKEAAARDDLAEAQAYIAEHEGSPFIIMDEKLGILSRVNCRCCGEVIIQTVESEDPLYTRQINGKTVVFKTVVQSVTPNYAQYRLVFDDGSAHVGNCCRNCLPKILSGEISKDRLYADDLAQWLTEKGGSRIVADNARRRPVMAIREDIL